MSQNDSLASDREIARDDREHARDDREGARDDREGARDDREGVRVEVAKVDAARVNSLMASFDHYRPILIAGAICLFIVLVTMAYGIVNTNNRASENQELYKATVRCVSALTSDNPNLTRPQVLEACKDFRKDVQS